MFLRGFNAIPFDGYVLPVAAPPPAAATLFEALRARMKGNAELSDLADVYKNQPRKGWAYPYMVISSIIASDDINNTRAYIEAIKLQFSVIAPDDLQAERLGRAAYRSLLPVSKADYPPLLFRDGYEIVRLPDFREKVIQSPNRGPGNASIWMYAFQYTFMIGRES